MRVGVVGTPVGTVTLSCAYRTNLAFMSNRQEDVIIVKHHYFLILPPEIMCLSLHVIQCVFCLLQAVWAVGSDHGDHCRSLCGSSRQQPASCKCRTPLQLQVAIESSASEIICPQLPPREDTVLWMSASLATSNTELLGVIASSVSHRMHSLNIWLNWNNWFKSVKAHKFWSIHLCMMFIHLCVCVCPELQMRMMEDYMQEFRTHRRSAPPPSPPPLPLR